MTRPNGLLLRPTTRIAGGLSVSGTWDDVRAIYELGPSPDLISYVTVLSLRLHT
jgi:hypothetical protein